MKLGRVLLVLIFLLLIASAAVLSQGGDRAPQPIDRNQLPPAYVPTGKQMYKDYCAACHGADGKGHGPVAPTLRMRVPDLTSLARKHNGVFPRGYVEGVLRFGPAFGAHGSSDMPVWGSIFQYMDHYNEAAVRERIKNLCDFLESIQEPSKT